MPDHFLQAVVKELTADATVSALATATPAITQDNPYNNTLEGAGTAQLVVRQNGNWTAPVQGRTSRYPWLVIEAWVDPTRDSDGNVTTPDSNLRARQILDAVSDVLHLVNGLETWGDDFLVIGSQRLIEPRPVARPPTDDELAVWRTEFGVITY